MGEGEEGRVSRYLISLRSPPADADALVFEDVS